MDRDFMLATELTEEGVGGDWLVTPSANGATSQNGARAGMNLQAETNGGLGLLIGCLALWAVWWMFPGNQRDPRPDTTQVSPPPAWSAAPPALPPTRQRPLSSAAETRKDPSMQLTWTDRRAVHGCDISACFFNPDEVDRETDFTRRMLPVFKAARPALLFSERDRKNFVADPLIAQPDAVLRHGQGLLSLEYKSQSRRSHRPEQWQRDIPCSGVLQTLAAAMAVAMESGRTVAPLLRCHNAIYFLRPDPELVARVMSSATEAKAYWGEQRYVSASQLASYCEPWVRARFGIKDDAQAASSEAGRVRHEEMLRR